MHRAVDLVAEPLTAIRAVILAAFLLPAVLAAAPAQTDVLRLAPASGPEDLPELPGSARDDDWKLDIAESQTALAYGSAGRRWNARIDHPLGLPASMRLAHAFRVSDKLGAGAGMRHGGGMSEILVNAIYAHRHNLRVRMAAGQRSSAGGSDAGPPVEQQTYLLGAKKYWDDRLWTDASVSLYAGQARNAANSMSGILESDEIESTAQPWHDDAVLSRMHGATLNLGFAPAARTRVELRHEFGQTSHYFRARAALSEDSSLSRIRLQQEFGGCSLLSGGFTAGEGGRHIELQLRHANWSIQAWQDLGPEPATSVLIGFSRALGEPESRSRTCAHEQAPRRFEPMIRAAERRPDEFSYAGLGSYSED